MVPIPVGQYFDTPGIEAVAPLYSLPPRGHGPGGLGCLVLRAAIYLVFYGFLRPGEFTVTRSQAPALAKRHLIHHPTYLSLCLEHSKTLLPGKSIEVKYFTTHNAWCLVEILDQLFHVNIMASPGYPYPRSPNSICSLPVDVRPHSINSSLSHRERRQESRNGYLGCSDRSFYDMSETFDEDSCEGDCGIPDVKLIEKIVSQVEFYLSDENLSRDAFLLKHVQKNKLGFVSIKLLTSFKKIKSFTRDWRQTLYALRFSDILEVNEEETKVRRKTPVPNSLLGLPPTKLLLAWNLDSTDKTSPVKPQKNFLEMVTSLFASFGILTSVRILKPGKEVPSDVKKYLARYPELATKNCALVEYENLEGARKALEAFSIRQSATNGDGAIRVVPVSGRGTRKKSGMESDEAENCDLPDKKLPKQHGRLPIKLQYTVEDASCCSSSESDSAPASPVLAPRFPCAMNFASPDLSFKPSFFSSPRSSPLLARKCFSQPHHNLSPLATDHGNRVCSSSGTSPEMFQRNPEHSYDSGICSWVQRRKAAAHNQYMENKSVPCSPLVLKKAPGSLGLPSGILRLPHGPDGSRGFHNSIGRGKLVLRH
ncbi:PREDICTED: la-related protein 6-like [Nanorana parkeri]|uniref:la-related protein 6-like n=1 Tax=Nanorana parkeri TaxID=125878 RepID=UPI000854C634|nr:PREDICTED: la-related protein 6-like [Nanorana parkeri]